MMREFSCLRVDGDRVKDKLDPVVVEMPLSIEVDGICTFTTLSPSMVEEFVLGRLFSEGIIEGLEDVRHLELVGDKARVEVARPKRHHLRGTGSSFQTRATGPAGTSLSPIQSDLVVDADQIRFAVDAVTSSELHGATGGVHVVGLFGPGGPLCVAEDLGRHNALDKVLGHGLRAGLDFGETFVASTSRISHSMVMKLVRAGIPLVASRGATTSLAVEVAKEAGLCIVGFVRGSRMNVYSGSWRVRVGGGARLPSG